MSTAYGILYNQVEVGPIVSEIEPVYTLQVESARTESGQEAYAGSIGSFSKFTTYEHPNTGNKIEGWHWNERIWSSESVENCAAIIPHNWDPTTSGITQTYFQSGIGSNNDLLLEDVEYVPSSGLNNEDIYNLWSPRINHGYYYKFEDQDYLFSDDSELVFFTYSGVADQAHVGISGFNSVELNYRPKITVPIKVKQFEWSTDDQEYTLSKDLKKKIYFTGTRDEDLVRQDTYDANKELILWDYVDQTEDEFIVINSGTKTRIILNNQYSELVGGASFPGSLEILGYSDGSTNQEFHTQYAPIDRSMGVGIYSYLTVSGIITTWEAVSLTSTVSGYQAYVDYDLGIIEFGDNTISGVNVPSAGSTIGVSYYKTVFAEYEPENTNNFILATEANINPIYRHSNQGFVYLSTRLENPSSIVLQANTVEISDNIFGPVYIGNNYTSIIATVYDSNGQTIEGETVEFIISSDQQIGSFGGFDSATATTNSDGEAKTYYNTPSTINDIGEYILSSQWSTVNNPTDVQYSGLSQVTKLNTQTLSLDGDLSDVYLYGVYANDPIMGYYDPTLSAAEQISGYYTSFFDEQLVLSGVRDFEWEDTRRQIWDLSRPSIFSTRSNSGRKLIVSKFDSSYLNPYTFEYGAVGPVQPIYIENSGVNNNYVAFDTSTNPIPQPTGIDYTTSTSKFHSYFLIAPCDVKFKAYLYNQYLGQYIYSNEITLKLSIPTYMNGIWYLDAINQSHIDEVSGLLATITASGQKVPLGFRLRSSNVTLASALDAVTFLDINRPFNDDIYDADTVSGIRLAHEVTVSGIIP